MLDDYPVKFQPYQESVNKLQLDADFDSALMKNNYTSTLHFVDNLVGRVLDDLSDRDLLDNIAVMIIGDYGHEFNEYGKNYWGHGSNFGDYQLRMPMVVHCPGKKVQRIDYRTKNFDIAPTLMRDLPGCHGADPSHYATGNGLLKSQEHPWGIAHSYMNYTLLTKDLAVVTHALTNVGVVRRSFEPLTNFELKPSTAIRVLEELS